MNFIKSFLFAIPLAVVNLTPSACAQGVCNIYGCSSCGECTIYGCPPCGRGNSGGYGGYGGNQGGGSSGGPKQICNIYGCGVSPNIYGASPNGVCTIYGCP